MTEDVKVKAEQYARDFALSIKERTDKLLKLDCIQYTNLGSDKILCTFGGRRITKIIRCLKNYQEVK